MAEEKATLGGGCFWCLEAVFTRLEGVFDVESGYAGGTKENPSYEEVCSGSTGHAEVVQVTYDPEVLAYREVLEVFFATHDPTTLNRQGADVGTQYRSIILTHDDAQRDTAAAVVRELTEEDVFGAPIVTEVEPVGRFWPAEDYHRRYYERNRFAPYCVSVIRPKVVKLRKSFAHRLKEAP